MEIYEHICSTFFPNQILTKYMMTHIPSSMDYWLVRKQFTVQYASQIFMTYSMAIGHRQPHKISWSLKTGNLFGSELYPSLNSQGLYALSESVPFRLTPNLQSYMGAIALEGLLAPSIFLLAKCLTEFEFEMEDFLSFFIRDELFSAYQQSSHSNPSHSTSPSNTNPGTPNTSGNPISSNTSSAPSLSDETIMIKVFQNLDLVYKRTLTLACLREREKLSVESIQQLLSSQPPSLPVPSLTPSLLNNNSSTNSNINSNIVNTILPPIHQTILDLISSAVNPQKLLQMDPQWHPWM